ncbi:MAG: hypothetical protein DRJ64_06520, partial [Thermoprotei archaeon]
MTGEENVMIRWQDEKDRVLDILKKIGLKAKSGGGYVFRVILARFEDGKLKVRARSMSKQTFIIGEFNTAYEGGGDVVLEVEKMIDLIKDIFNSQEKLDIKILEGGTAIVIESEDDIVNIPCSDVSTESQSLEYFRNLPFKVDESTNFKNETVNYFMKGTVEPDTMVKIDSSELKKVLGRESDFDVDYYHLRLKQEENSNERPYIALGVGINMRNLYNKSYLKCKIEGKGAGTIVGSDFNNIVNNLDGEVKV